MSDPPRSLGSNGSDRLNGADPAAGAPAMVAQGPQRKQNIACDACRGKKIKCTRLSINERCEQCVNRGTECTSHYIEGLQDKSGKKGSSSSAGTAPARKRSGLVDVPGEGLLGAKRSRTSLDFEDTLASGTRAVGAVNGASTGHAGESSRMGARLPSQRQHNLLRYLFAPQPVLHHEFGYTDESDIEFCQRGITDMWEQQGGAVWGEEPSAAHWQLNETTIPELADDILETWWSIAHTRHPLLDPANFRARYLNPDTHPDGPLSHALIAACIAFGGRSSEHPIIADDRDEMLEHDGAGGRPRSRIVQLLLLRCREVVEVVKVQRHPTLENCQTIMLLEPLLNQAHFLKDKYNACYNMAGVRHIYVIRSSGSCDRLRPMNDGERKQLSSTWWWLGLSDAFRSVFHRLNPCIWDDTFSVEPINPDINPNNPMWPSAIPPLVLIARRLARVLSVTRVRMEGIPLSVINEFMSDNNVWRETYLLHLGIPSSFPVNWDFLAAIRACGVDVYYHALWLVMYHSAMEYGVKEMKDLEKRGQTEMPRDVDASMKRLREEAEHSAFRIAALAAVLTENGYLRLDPCILNHPIYEAGLFLADNGKEECRACIAGLKQYSIAYGGMWDLAEEIERLYQLRTLSPMSWPLNLAAGAGSIVQTPTSNLSLPTVPTSNLSAAPTPVVEAEWKPHGAPIAMSQSLALPGQSDVALALFDWLHNSAPQ